MKQKDFVFNLCILLFLNLLIKPFWLFGIDIGVQNRVGAADYGMYFALFNFTYLFNILLDMGTTNYNNCSVARQAQLQEKQLSGIVTLRFLLGAVYMTVVFVLALVVGYRGLQLKLLFWTAINQFLNAFMLYLRSNVSALMMFKTDSVLSVLDRLLMILFCGILLWGNVLKQPFRIEWFVYCQTAAYVLAILAASLIVVSHTRFRRLSWDWTFFKTVLRNSLPFATLTLLMSCYYRIDSVMIERMLPENVAAAQAGVYASAFRLLDALVMVAYLFSVILLPLFSRMIARKENLRPIIKTSFSLLFVFCCSAVTILFAYRQPLMELLYHNHIEESVQVFSVLLFSIVPISFTYLFGTLLTANGNMKKLNITAAVGIVVNVTINLLLIPRIAACGAAVAGVCTQAVVCIVETALAAKALRLPLRMFPWLSCGMFSVLLAVVTAMCHRFLHCHVLVALTALAIAALGIGFATRLIQVKQMRDFESEGEGVSDFRL